ncbi:MAG: signal peptidase I [Clostridiales bacterium]|nr:signal peptidase I [Clostridiales bacterium]
MKARKIREWLEALLWAAIICAALYFVFWPVKIEGQSMRENYLPGDYVMVSRLMVMAGRFSRGDALLSAMPYGDARVIKRLIGLPGERVQIKDGQVLLNGQVLREDYATGYTSGSVDILLGEDEYFLMGDNRAVSVDSRAAGAFNRALLQGKVIARIGFGI